MSMDVLYEPLKELLDKFPLYLANAATLSSADKTRGAVQQASVAHIIAIIEDPGYSNAHGEDRCALRIRAEAV